MKALVVSLESFQKGDIPEEVKRYIVANKGNIFTVLDESSKIKTNNPCKESKKSKRTQAILKLANFGERCILTGTFMSKSPVNAYDQMNFLCPNFFSESMFSFGEKYTIRRNLPSMRGARVLISPADYTTIRKRLMLNKDNPSALLGAMEAVYRFYGISREDCEHIMQHAKYTPFKNLDELWKRIGDTCFKVDRKDLYDLPETIYRRFELPLTAEQKRLYLSLQNLHCTEHATVENGLQLALRFQDICNGYEPYIYEDVTDEGEIEKITELVPLKENPKLEALEEIMDEIGEEQVVIWCSRSKLLYDAKARLEDLGYKCGVYDGISKKTREEDYEKFAKKELQVIFMNQRSGAYGLDKLKEADYAIYLSNTYSVEERQQSEGRTARGQYTHNKFVIDITYPGTCEDRVLEALKQGEELIDTGTADPSLYLLHEEECIF